MERGEIKDGEGEGRKKEDQKKRIIASHSRIDTVRPPKPTQGG